MRSEAPARRYFGCIRLAPTNRTCGPRRLAASEEIDAIAERTALDRRANVRRGADVAEVAIEIDQVAVSLRSASANSSQKVADLDALTAVRTRVVHAGVDLESTRTNEGGKVATQRLAC